QCRLMSHAPAGRSAKPAWRSLRHVPTSGTCSGGLLIRTIPRTCRIEVSFNTFGDETGVEPVTSDYQSDALPLSYSQSSFHAVSKLFTEHSRSIHGQTERAASRRG